MSVREAIAELLKQDQNATVFCEWEAMPPCNCLEHCYCSPEVHEAELRTVDGMGRKRVVLRVER